MDNSPMKSTRSESNISDTVDVTMKEDCAKPDLKYSRPQRIRKPNSKYSSDVYDLSLLVESRGRCPQ